MHLIPIAPNYEFRCTVPSATAQPLARRQASRCSGVGGGTRRAACCWLAATVKANTMLGLSPGFPFSLLKRFRLRLDSHSTNLPLRATLCRVCLNVLGFLGGGVCLPLCFSLVLNGGVCLFPVLFKGFRWSSEGMHPLCFSRISNGGVCFPLRYSMNAPHLEHGAWFHLFSQYY